MNDPNGFHLGKDGIFYLYYQYHDLIAHPSFLSWRLATSKDLVVYKDEGVKLMPKFPYEGIGKAFGGCWSGSSYSYNGQKYLAYAAAEENKQTFALAKLGNDGLFHQIPDNPVAYPPEWIQEDSFRDPYVFSYKGKTYFIIGAMDTHKRGRILLYELKGEKAIYKSVFYQDDSLYMFECPCLLFLSDYVLLISSPIGLKRKGYIFQNDQNNIGILGHISDGLRFIPESEPFDLDSGFDYYAAQGTDIGNGQGALTAWLSLWGKDFDKIPTRELSGYLGCMALPRLLSVENGQLRQRPYPSINDYFGESKQVTSNEFAVPSNSRIRFSEIKGDFKATFFSNPHGGIDFEYDPNTNLGIMLIRDDREVAKSGLYTGTERFIEFPNGLTSIEAYIDSYVLELFFNDGQKYMSVMYYPTIKEDKVKIVIIGPANIEMSRFGENPLSSPYTN